MVAIVAPLGDPPGWIKAATTRATHKRARSSQRNLAARRKSPAYSEGRALGWRCSAVGGCSDAIGFRAEVCTGWIWEMVMGSQRVESSKPPTAERDSTSRVADPRPLKPMTTYRGIGASPGRVPGAGSVSDVDA